MIGIIDQKQLVIARHVTAMRPNELALAPGIQELAVLVEDNDRMLATAEDEHPILRIDSKRRRPR